MQYMPAVYAPKLVVKGSSDAFNNPLTLPGRVNTIDILIIVSRPVNIASSTDEIYTE